jgi:ABC-type Na+ efflux pump permease subunit
MRKIWAIAWKELYTTYTDRNLVLIMIAAPLAVATIVGLAFGGFGSGDVPITDIPIAIVNQDTGSNGQNFGQIFVTVFIPDDQTTGTQLPPCDADEQTDDSANQNTLLNLTDAVTLDSPEAARAAVDNGEYTAAIIIPPDFTQKISYGVNDPIEPTGVEVYANSGRTVPAGIIRSIAEGIANQIATANITVASTLETVAEDYGLLQVGTVASSDSFARNISCAFSPAFNTLSIDQQTVSGQKANNTAAILVFVGSAQAMFFTMFTGQGGVAGIFEERRQGTLQRLVVSPTPRLYILLGKLAGTFVNCFLQIIFLLIALTLVASVLTGSLTMIWGSNLLGITVIVFGASLAATGLGALMGGISRSPEQGQIVGQVINISLAVLGGSFGFQLPEALARLSLIYWGSDAFRKLSNNQSEIGLNALVLVVQGVILFAVGFWLFNKRLDI